MFIVNWWFCITGRLFKSLVYWWFISISDRECIVFIHLLQRTVRLMRKSTFCVVVCRALDASLMARQVHLWRIASYRFGGIYHVLWFSRICIPYSIHFMSSFLYNVATLADLRCLLYCVTCVLICWLGVTFSMNLMKSLCYSGRAPCRHHKRKVEASSARKVETASL